MALTKINFYLSVIFLVIMIFSGVGYVGVSFINNTRIDLDSDSLDYIAEVRGVNAQSGYENIANTPSEESQQTDVLNNPDDQQVSDANDFLSTLYIKKERASEPVNFFYLIYNIPSSMVMGLGLDPSDWTHYINIISFLLFISLIIMVWIRLVNT